MAKPLEKNPVLTINASVRLKDDQRFTLLRNLDHTPPPGEILEIEGQSWRVVEWTDRIECEWVVS